MENRLIVMSISLRDKLILNFLKNGSRPLETYNIDIDTRDGICDLHLHILNLTTRENEKS